MRELLPFEPPRLEEISTVTLSTQRYEQLLDAETRLDIVLDILKNYVDNVNYIDETTRNLFIATGHTGYLQNVLKERGKDNG